MKENTTLKFKEIIYFIVSIKNKYSTKEWKKK